jgi:hypothetical protein
MAVPTRNVAADLVLHLTPTSGTIATAVTITGPITLAAYTSALTNTTTGPTGECTDPNYARVPVSAWTAPATTAGAGYNVGVVGVTNNVPLTMGGPSGFSAAQSIAAYMALSSDTTPVEVQYLNLAAALAVPAANQLTVAAGAFFIGVS